MRLLHSLLVHLLMSIWVASTLGLLQIRWLQTRNQWYHKRLQIIAALNCVGYRHSCLTAYTHPGVKLLCHLVCVYLNFIYLFIFIYLNFRRNFWFGSFYIPTSSVWMIQLLYIQPLVWSVFVILTILMDVHSIVVLICISLMTKSN